ncbi:hypothetical protein DPMN_194152 [Dreissena polymorpha]|uniref:Uncharacterized protein n=1 Tax=Dreissena polymorpha TaxID=45954 RepID=A0A9D3Y4R5_DREPO|nr:hypothetical protein DPMN_194152 [Dreissena polymorpha]
MYVLEKTPTKSLNIGNIVTNIATIDASITTVVIVATPSLPLSSKTQPPPSGEQQNHHNYHHHR